MRLPWDDWEVVDTEVGRVAEKFVMANCYDPKVAMQFFQSHKDVVPGIEFLKSLCFRKKFLLMNFNK